ncbi:TraR/DksA family transcriptional regulator [Curtobacterium sp. MCSS17_016]|uniref:TraR/DksA family transcriptional regulator n=1 Tax=Curtobacterium sp. MCSS17_016 TaxID=2175644 RepID=UPI000DA7AA91|nr:TraR/DksA family transcriptional regulator [Curtobacterium sp. MCSS17_016]WIE81015.1 hypothetical protein DEJ19_021095 [Curtobacterium sp. MCSS17_016]
MTDHDDILTVSSADTFVECGDGWFPLLRRLDSALRNIDPNYEALQVKEKFGTLRFYASTIGLDEDASSQFHKLIADAEGESARTCETCGQPGSLRNDRRWLKTLCDAHAATR